MLAERAPLDMRLMEIGVLRAPGRAVRSWGRYREQRPRGVLRAEADLSIIEMLTRLGQEGRALDEARGFLRRNPGSERRGPVGRGARRLARTGGGCAAAGGVFYEGAPPHPSSPRARAAGLPRAG